MNPLNSPLEVGMRTLMLLAAAFPQPLDVGQLVYLDHLMLHSSEVDGPPSLHPTLPAGPGELAMKRGLIEQGLIVLLRAGLADIEATADGLLYRASEEGPGFVDILAAPYAGALKERASWAIGIEALPDQSVRAQTQAITQRWAEDFASRLPTSESDLTP
ncbi:ABC-three component system middle component 2 [Streptomyces mangrovisoli]|uniref:Threonine transporter n=1 Tax=Streptomyces mangrovisoli TaxID=1428628 RepID=A0A1J4NMQ9_9ACTN|nr:ABC-three component system middle component 2 [Streptomyces mangrovisoli]OIJ63426.1 threonine transporter [Streptomyces mangrovisoli]